LGFRFAKISWFSRTLWHVSNLFYTPRAVELAEALTATTTWAKRAFFCNSGAESNEAMLKLARKFHADQGHPERNEIVACENSFHGRTMFALSVTGQPKYHHGFEPLVPGIRFVRYGDAEALAAALGPRTAAFIVEPIQGEAGVMPAPAGYLAKARELTRRAGALLLFDEVQTGMGRTGKMWAHEWEGVTPDLMSSADDHDQAFIGQAFQALVYVWLGRAPVLVYLFHIRHIQEHESGIHFRLILREPEHTQGVYQPVRDHTHIDIKSQLN
jgi:acetylornithine/succinyldiaminopimelate/putrescine aminotransferase